MEFFYDGQIKRYLNQFMRAMSNFSYMDGNGNQVQVPVRYGDINRQVAAVIAQGSENILNSAPAIACYIKGFDYDRTRIQNPYHVSKMQIRERAFDEQGNEYINEQGENYTIERLMPVPYTIQFTADIWTTNTDQKLQILEQILVLFNPAMEIQTTNNFVDWTSLSYLELTGVNWTNRSVGSAIPADEIDIASLSFTTPVWLTTPAKVKQMGIITKIITNIFTEPAGTDLVNNFDFVNKSATVTVTPGNYGLFVLGNKATLMKDGDRLIGDEYIQVPEKTGVDINWYTLLDMYPGKFRSGLSTIRFIKPDGTEVVGYITVDPSDDRTMLINYEGDTLLNTMLPDLTNTYVRGSINAIIDPQRFNPGSPSADDRYLILEDIGSNADDGPDGWKNSDNSDFHANANDIIQWDGIRWNVIFNSQTAESMVYITNQYTGIQYKWDGSQWSKSYEGLYTPGEWRLVL